LLIKSVGILKLKRNGIHSNPNAGEWLTLVFLSLAASLIGVLVLRVLTLANLTAV
jgi:hypothetical protein